MTETLKRMKRLFCRMLAVAVCIPLIAAAEERDPILESYVRLAFTQNPVIPAADIERDAAGKRVSSAGTLPDPMLKFGLNEFPLEDEPGATASRLRRSGKWIGIEQQFPYPGTLKAQRAIAESEWNMKSAMSDAERAMLILDIKTAYYEWSRVRSEIALVEQARSLLTSIREQALAGFSAGTGSLTEVLRIETEITKMDAELADLAAMERTAIAEINICCSLPPDSMTRPPLPLKFMKFEYRRDSLEARIASTSPEYTAANFAVTMAENELRMARRDRYPMFLISAEYMQRTDAHGTNDMDMMSVMGGLTLPIHAGKKQNRIIESRSLEVKRAQASRDVKWNDLRFALSRNYSQQRSLAEQIALYATQIVPHAQSTYESALSGYGAGSSEFMTLLDSQMTLIEAERMVVRLTADYLTSWSRIEVLTGERLF